MHNVQLLSCLILTNIQYVNIQHSMRYEGDDKSYFNVIDQQV